MDSTSTALDLIKLDGLIKSHITQIEKFREESSELNGMIEDILINDALYVEQSELAKKATKDKLATRQQLLKLPQAAELANKLKALKSQTKEVVTNLSDYLQEYARLSGQREIEDQDGHLREIIYIAKLIKKSR